LEETGSYIGKTQNAYGGEFYLQPNAADNVRFADETSKKIKMMIDEYIQKSHLYAPPPEEDPDDNPVKQQTLPHLLLRWTSLKTK